MIQVLLSPNAERADELGPIYNRALQQAEELYVASAFLTDWDRGQKLGSACKRSVFLVGTDFGLTRKAALRAVLRWMPRGPSHFFGAVRALRGGFHPKIVAWKARSGKHHCIIGSSNLSKAAFSVNYEANVLLTISAQEFDRLRAWLDPITEQAEPVTEDWINHHYRERRIVGRGRGGRGRGVLNVGLKLRLPEGRTYEQEVRGRRRQHAAFDEIADKIIADARWCSKGKISNNEFWLRFWRLWSRHESRFQGSGLQFTGKSAPWRQACSALLNILDAANSITHPQLDHLVGGEIDRLARNRNPARGAWLTEMLCHFLPNLYPIMNTPVRKWLSRNNWRARRGASEGQQYIDLAQKLRKAVSGRPAGARNLAELDAAIWRWAYNRGLLTRRV